jgi:hypothetical protein
VPSAGVAKCFNLAPGSVIYVPPGCWHRVVPVSGDSLSADIRAAHIHRATWMAESLFATALAHLHGSRAPAQSPGHSTATSPGELAFLPVDAQQQRPPNPSWMASLGKAAAHLDPLMHRCLPPRCLPAESKHSDGLVGAHRRLCVSVQYSRG